MIARELEVTLQNLFVDARSKRHEYITVEHLLLGLLDNPAVAEAFRACGANIDELRARLIAHTTRHTPVVAPEREVNTQPTMGFQRTIQRAILQTQSSDRKEVASTDVLVAIFGESDSHAVYFLDDLGVDRVQVARHLGHDSTDAGVDFEAPQMRQIIFFQDQRLPAETTAQVLQDFLLMEKEELAEMLSELADKGKAVCGLYARETAEFVVEQIRAFAVKHRLPLRCEAVVQSRGRSSSSEK